MKPIQYQNIDGRDNQQAGRDINNYYKEELLPLQKVILNIKNLVQDDPSFEGFIDDLAYYSLTEIDTIGLEKKLVLGKREDLIERALILKDLFARKLYKNQLSIVMQHAYVHILAYICTSFNNNIKPLIAAGCSPEEIDKSIHKEIIENVYHQLAEFSVDITTEHIHGMLFFLTGKCHLKWS